MGGWYIGSNVLKGKEPVKNVLKLGEMEKWVRKQKFQKRYILVKAVDTFKEKAL